MRAKAKDCRLFELVRAHCTLLPPDEKVARSAMLGGRDPIAFEIVLESPAVRKAEREKEAIRRCWMIPLGISSKTESEVITPLSSGDCPW
jgi:hypothetical protein